jgi:hypothetical protein
MKYEYHFPVFSAHDTYSDRQTEFNELGKQGWYYIGLDNHGNHVFVRQLELEQTQVPY